MHLVAHERNSRPPARRSRRTADTVLVTLLAALLAGHADLPAQSWEPSTYRRTAGDTLRFREVTRGEISVTGPQGTLVARTTHEALIALTFGAGDTALAWFEEISLGLDAGAQSMRPAMGALIRRPYTLLFTERGHVRTIESPDLPLEIAQVSDLARQFDDFFLRLPREPLREGFTWSDTVAISDSTSETDLRRMQRVGSYRVSGDTVIAGERAVVIDATLETTIDATAAAAGQPEPAHAELGGSEQATFFFAPGPGRLLGRVRQGEIAGVITIGGRSGVEMRQRHTYTSRIEAVR